ncbi:hypothetical protein BHM03_00045570 [Ensete ventricosum]|nr:hypothetical protein BHM03_00045570 [Ensete ventricosum]
MDANGHSIFCMNEPKGDGASTRGASSVPWAFPVARCPCRASKRHLRARASLQQEDEGASQQGTFRRGFPPLLLRSPLRKETLAAEAPEKVAPLKVLHGERSSKRRDKVVSWPGPCAISAVACFSRLDYVANTISAVVSLRRRSLSSLLSLAAVAVAVAATPLAVRSAHLDSTVNSILLS